MAGAARILMDAVLRAGRQAQPAAAIVLNLSALAPPAPLPHHRRIARALLDATAQHFGGEVVALGGGDFGLVCRDGGVEGGLQAGMQSGSAWAAEPAALPGLLRRLLRAECGSADALVRLWRLPDETAALCDLLLARKERTPEPPPLPPLPLPPRAALAELLHRQTAVALLPGARQLVLQPLFHEVTVSLKAVAALDETWRAVDGCWCTARSLMPALDARLLALLRRMLGAGGPLDAALATQPALHVDLTPRAIASDEFFRFAEACAAGAAPGRVSIELSLLEALGDPDSFAAARERVREAGFAWLLDAVPIDALLLTDLSALAPPRLKLCWSERALDLPDDALAAIDAALERIGPARVLLYDADGDAAIRWGLARRIRRFQGPAIDAMLARGRVEACAIAEDCTEAQCAERARACAPAGRVPCRNTALLDAAAA